MTIKRRLYSIQNQFHQSIQDSNQIYLGNLPQELKTYYGEYDKEFGGRWKKTSKNKLLDTCLGSSLVLLGDYHSSSQAQRTVLRVFRGLLSQLRRHQRKPYLCLELLRAEHNLWVQSYQKGQISKQVFLKKIEFHKWGFQWENYEPLFEFARKFQIPIIGVSPKSKSSLLKRDLFAASILVNWLQKDPRGFFVCLMGDLHLAEKHLPQKIKNELRQKKVKRRVVVIHQNHENLYFKFCRKATKQRGEVLAVGKNTFCILNTPPWMKLYRHLQWLEHQELQGEERLDWFLKIQKTIVQFLGLPPSFLEDGSLINPSDLSVNLNHLAAFTAKRIHMRLSGRALNEKSGQVHLQFFSLLWIEALGWLGSKVINPDRKTLGLIDFKNGVHPQSRPLLSYFEAERKMKSANKKSRQLILSQFMKSKKSSSLELVYRAAGALLGNSLYGLIEQGEVSSAEIRTLFKNPFYFESEDLYFLWLKRVDGFRLRNFSSQEKL